MTDAVLAAVIASIPSTFAAIATLIVAVRTGRKTEQVHKEMNSMKDELVALTRVEAHAAGVLEGRGHTEPEDLAND